MNPDADAAKRQLLSQLADINGLGPVAWWPLAPGWWAAIAGLLFIALALSVHLQRRRVYRHSWKSEANAELAHLQATLADATAADILASLTVLLRRIAVKRFSREACAGLEGTAWTTWLEAHDPNHFPWSEHAAFLTRLAYAPPGTGVTAQNVRPLIEATRKWVR